MSRKDIIVMSVLINAGLIIILLVSSLTTKESYFVASSAKVAGSILESNENGMLPTIKPEGKAETAENLIGPQNVISPAEVAGLQNVVAVSDPQTTDMPLVKMDGQQDVVHKLPALSTIENVELVKELPLVEKPKERLVEVKVKKGDTLEKIAKANHTSVSDIVRVNELPNTFLKVGQILLIPKVETIVRANGSRTRLSDKNSLSEANYYTVKCGDNPWTIAMKHHLKVDELLKLNNLNSASAKKLRAGDKLRIK